MTGPLVAAPAGEPHQGQPQIGEPQIIQPYIGEPQVGEPPGVDHRPIRAMSAEERRAYNRLVKQRSRAKAALKTRTGSLPSTKEAAITLVAVAASRVALEEPGMLSGRLALEVASLVGAPCDAGFEEGFGALLRRIASPRRMTVNVA